ncbi:MAG: EAL domain-containing protein [Rhodocyclaceae bacterium]|nr:EAL domain-containing protein [Rhodocyclaceae bacterium]
MNQTHHPERLLNHPDVLDSLRAGRHQEFVAFLQSKVCLATRRTIGYEALLRWLPQPGIALSPELTLPAIEAHGMLYDIWLIMLKQACALLRRTPAERRSLHPISINLHPGLLSDPLLAANAAALAANMGVEPSLIEFEIVETGKISDMEFAASSIIDLREAGFKVSLDDFGVGYASLLHLAYLPVTGVKIDRAFLSAPQGEPIIRHLAALAKEMGMTIVVEGIETEEQAGTAFRAGAGIGQGFLFSRPRHADEVWHRHI